MFTYPPITRADAPSQSLNDAFKEVYFPACAEARSRSLAWQKTQKKEFVALARKLHDAEAP